MENKESQCLRIMIFMVLKLNEKTIRHETNKGMALHSFPGGSTATESTIIEPCPLIVSPSSSPIQSESSPSLIETDANSPIVTGCTWEDKVSRIILMEAYWRVCSACCKI